MTLFVDINVIATYDINDINLEVDINVSLPLGTMLALRRPERILSARYGDRTNMHASCMHGGLQTCLKGRDSFSTVI